MSPRARPSIMMMVWSMAATAMLAAVGWWKMDVARVDAAIEQTQSEFKTLSIGGRIPSTPAVSAYLTERGRAMEAQHLAARQWLTAPSDALAAGTDPQLFFQQQVHEMHLRLEHVSAARTLPAPSILGLPKELPPSDAVPRFLAQVRLVEELADMVFAEPGVTHIESFKVEDPESLPPPGEHASAFLSRLPVRVRLTCSMESLAKILGRLERVQPLISLESMRLSAVPGLKELTVDFAAVRYLVTAELREIGASDESDEVSEPVTRGRSSASKSTRVRP